MKFSIIVPIYGVESYLYECIDSVLKQSYTNWELILVDDGSTDNCPQICDEYSAKDKRIKVLHKRNGGLVSARKAGAVIATGSYALCLDGDDFLHEDCLEILNQELEKHPNTDVICFGSLHYYDKTCRQKPIHGFRYGHYNHDQIIKEIYPNLIYSKSLRRFPHEVWGKAIRMPLYKKYQMKVSSEISMGEDAACIHTLLTNVESISLLFDCLYYYRQIGSSMTKKKKPLEWDNYDKIFELYEQEIKLDHYDFRKQIQRLRTHNLFNITMSQFYSDKPYKQIVCHILNRFKEHPEYDIAINNSDFASIPMKIIRNLLKYRCFRIIRFYACNRQTLKYIKEKWT